MADKRIARFVAGVIAAAAAPLLASPRTPPPAPADTLAVHIKLEFDPSITSSTIKMLARDEAAATWKVYGVDLRWAEPAARTALSLDAFVTRGARPIDANDSPAVLGSTTVSSIPAAPAPIRLSFDAVEALVERRHGANPLLHDREVGIALGRILAHEVGHVLLGAPSYHDPAGLMRSAFLPDDLVQPARWAFRLMPYSVARLRARVVSASRSQSSEPIG